MEDGRIWTVECIQSRCIIYLELFRQHAHEDVAVVADIKDEADLFFAFCIWLYRLLQVVLKNRVSGTIGASATYLLASSQKSTLKLTTRADFENPNLL